MKKYIIIFLIIILCIILTSCNINKSEHDTIEIYNKSCTTFDNIKIDIKEEYFYDKHDKFTVDDNTVAVTVYFVRDGIDDWK